MHYYKKNLGDYYKKAGRLSILQHGVYTLLIDACYDRECFPTFDEAMDWTWAGTPDEVQAVEFVLKKFFTLEDGVYVQKRIKEELADYANQKAINSANGKKGGRPKKEQKDTDSEAEKTHSVLEETQSVNLETEKKPNQEPLTINHKPRTTNQEPVKKDTAQIGDKLPDKISPGEFPHQWSNSLYSPEDFEFTQKMLDSIRLVQPDFKQPDLNTWATTIADMQKQDGRNLKDMAEIWLFARSETFWSWLTEPRDFRKNYDKLKAKKISQGVQHETRQPVDNSPAAQVERAYQQLESEQRTERPIN